MREPEAVRRAKDLRDLAVAVVSHLRANGHEALFAGGCVRDALLGKEPKDYDVATSAVPQQVRKLFRRTLAFGASFGVVQVRNPAGLQVEVATFRADAGYSDGRRPDAISFTDARRDAERRDFTINGMFFDPIEERVLDYVGGQADLTAGRVRAIGDPVERIREDKLRMLRAVRFTARLGFALDSRTADAIRHHASELDVVSSERVLLELRAMLTSSPTSRRQALELLSELGLVPHALPEFATAWTGDATWSRVLATVAALGDLPLEGKPTLSLVFAGLSAATFPDAGEAAGRLEELGRRLKTSNEDRARAVWLVEQVGLLDGIAARPLSVAKRLLVHPGREELLLLHEALSRVDGKPDADAAHLRRLHDEWPDERVDPPPLLTGHDLIGEGFQAGPGMRQLIDAIRTAQLDERVATPEEALAFARSFQREPPKRDDSVTK